MASGISIEDMNKALGNAGHNDKFFSSDYDVKQVFDDLGHRYTDAIDSFAATINVRNTYEAKTKVSMKNTENPGHYTARDPRDRLIVDFDEAKWEIDVPGVEASDIEVYTVKDVVTVKVADSGKNYGFERKLQLLEGEKITESKLALGVLTITVDRPHKKVSFEVA